MAPRRPPTSVRFDEDEWRILEDLQRRSPFTIADLIRQAVRQLGRSGILVLPEETAHADEPEPDE